MLTFGMLTFVMLTFVILTLVVAKGAVVNAVNSSAARVLCAVKTVVAIATKL
jgi:hypothetical protein